MGAAPNISADFPLGVGLSRPLLKFSGGSSCIYATFSVISANPSS